MAQPCQEFLGVPPPPPARYYGKFIDLILALKISVPKKINTVTLNYILNINIKRKITWLYMALTLLISRGEKVKLEFRFVTI